MRTFICVAIIFFSLTAYGFTDEIKSTEKPEPYVYYCQKTGININIDGKLQEKSWEKASLVRPFWKLATNQEAGLPTYAKILWDGKFLYIGAELADKDIYGYHAEHDSYTWEDDVFEVFIKPRDDSSHYYEFHVTPMNTTLDLFIVRRGATGQLKRWSIFESGMATAVNLNGALNNWKDEDKSWSVEIAIPLSAFKETVSLPQAGDKWRFALCRYDYSVYLEEGSELSSSARLGSGSFHLFEDYDILCFQKE